MSDVLTAVRGVDNVRIGILRMSSPAASTSGRLIIRDGQYIIGASINEGPDGGYDACRRLLSLSEGNFAFLDTSGQSGYQASGNLYLSLEKVISNLGTLPAEPGDLFDEKALLDRVFGEGGTILPVQPSLDRRLDPGGLDADDDSSAEPIRTVPEPAVTWNAIGPLLLSGNQKPGAAGSVYDFGDAGDQYGSYTKLRSLPQEPPEAPPPQSPLTRTVLIISVAVAVLLTAAVTFTICSMLNKPSSLTIQDGRH